MKTTGTLLPLLLGFAFTAAAQTSAPTSDVPPKPAPEEPAKLSPATKQMLTDALPKFTPPAPAKPAPAPDPDVVVLPKMTVTQKKRPRLGDQVMMTSPAFNDKLAKEMMSDFDRSFLNKYDWLGPYSAAARAREDYDIAKKDELKADVFHLAKVVEQEDPAQAKALRDAVNKP